jgi:hypothetical protein
VPDRKNPVSNTDTTRLQSVWLTLLTVTLAVYLPFVWVLVMPWILVFRMLLLASGPALASQFLLTGLLRLHCPFLCEPFPLMVLTLSFFTWLGRRGGRTRVVATSCAFAWGLLLSAVLGFFVTHFHT